MYHKVKIKKLPNKAVGGGINGNRILNNQLLSWGGADFNMAPQKPKVTGTITGVPREEANLEAEGGETVYGDINGDGMAEHLTIQGPRHSSGGVPLNLPDGTFIFSDTKSMKIKDPAILALFNKPKGSYTPADLAKTADISKYRKILQDPDSDAIDRKTAELMIRNYNMKLGALALAQESKKGFPQGIPEVSRPYIMAHQIKDEDLMPQQSQQEEVAEGPMSNPQEEMMEQPMGQYGYEMPFYSGDAMPIYDEYAYGGSLNKYQSRGQVEPTYDVKDPNLRPDITGQGYQFVDPGKDYIYDQGSIGAQTSKKGYKVDPESGFWYDSKRNTPGKGGLEDFYNRHKFFIDKYKGKYGEGKDAWMKEQRESAGRKNPAMSYVINENNALYGKLSGGKQLVDTQQKGWEVPGVELFNMPGIQQKAAEEKKEEPKKKEEEKKEEITTQKPEQEQQEEQTPPAQVPPAAFWLQDTLKTAGAAANLAGIKKYMPWAPNADLQTATPTYLDPTRELAAQSEQANIASQANTTFAGPQALGARNAAVQGAGAKGAADTLSRYNNANVNLANQFAWKEADVNNQESMLNQASKQRLYDQNTSANQQYDNAKRQAKNALLNQYVNSITNKEKTNALNQMYPQFAVDPSKGGRMYYTGQDKKIKPETSKQLFDVATKYKNAGWKDEVAFKMAKDELGMGNPSDDLVDVDAYNQMYSGMKKGGTQFAYVMGANVFPPFFY